MTPKALLILLVLLVVLLPLLSTDNAAMQRPASTVRLVAEASAEVVVVEPTAEPTLVPTEAVTLEPTVEVTAEATSEVTVEAVLEPANTMLVGDPARGDVIFHEGLNGAPACINCHSTTNSGKQGFALGPGLLGISAAAGTRVEGMTAAQYVEHSIRNPNDYLVGGFRGIMYPSFGTDYTDQDITDLVAYVLTL